MTYEPKDPTIDLTPEELRRLNREQENSGDATRPWMVGGVVAIIVATLVYGYMRPNSTSASAPPSRSSPTTTGAAPALPAVHSPAAAPASAP